MTTMMQHPKHGKHPATGSEMANLKANGWTVCPPKVKAVNPVEYVEQVPMSDALPVTVDPVAEASESPAVTAASPKRRGKAKAKV